MVWCGVGTVIRESIDLPCEYARANFLWGGGAYPGLNPVIKEVCKIQWVCRTF